jgi:hypothetical protein
MPAPEAALSEHSKMGRLRKSRGLNCVSEACYLTFRDGISRPSFWEDIAMKASLLFVAGLAVAISSIAPANAEATRVTTGATTTSFRTGNAPWVGCSIAGGWNFSSTCRNLASFKSYNECTTGVAKMAGTSLESWWYCSSLGFKN